MLMVERSPQLLQRIVSIPPSDIPTISV